MTLRELKSSSVPPSPDPRRWVTVLMLSPWFGPLPEWMPAYRANVAAATADGFDWLIPTDLADFAARVRDRLGIECSIVEGGGKIHDYRAALGELYADEIAGYDWWGHTDLDCVYGRLAAFHNPETLDGIDVVSDHDTYLCGPWTLYRNIPEAASVFRANPEWRDQLTDPAVSGWVETSFTRTMLKSGLRVAFRLQHAWTDPGLLRRDGERLLHGDREVPFFHFRRTKRYPEVAAA